MTDRRPSTCHPAGAALARVTAGLAAVVVGLAVAGCTAGPGSPPASAGGTTPAGSPSASGAPTASGPSSAVPTPSDPLGVPSTAQSMMAQDALTSSTCEADAAGIWSFTGTLHNATDTGRTYTVAIVVMNGPNVTGHSMQTVTVPPGGTALVHATDIAVSSGSDGSGASAAAARCDVVVSQEVAK